MHWAALATLLLGSARANVVINEIHHSPDVKTEAVEFIELYNRSTNQVDLTGWTVTSGADFAMPPGTALAAGGYLVIAQNPAALRTKFGVDALGPWTGRLDGQGERIVLRDASGAVADEVEYGLGFPWPTVGDAPGYSMELVNPAVDNDLGGHWRASFAGGGQQQNTLLFASESEWRLFKGTSPPPPDWRELAFDESVWTAALAPVGYDPTVRMQTPLTDMRNGYVGFFLRRKFQVTDAASVTALSLDVLYDDGFKLWINGRNLLNVAMPDGEVPFDQPASPFREADSFEKQEFGIPPGLLREGENVIAVQLANVNVGGSSDAFFDCRLRAVVGPTGRGPTPGRLNAAFTVKVPPALRQVEHRPRQPRPGEPLVVSAKVTCATGMRSVTLDYQVVEPGQYIEQSDPAYAAQWTSIAMNDAGNDGDAVAGDNVFTATVPAAVQQHRRLVRYRLTAVDQAGVSVRVPYADDPQPNFAYFCYDTVPAWTGAIRPGMGGVLGRVITVTEQEMNRLPVYHLIARQSAVEDCTWYDRSHGDEYYWTGTLVYDGVVYDHIRFRPRGGVWRYAMGKNMWKFDFNRGHDFQPRDDWGRKLETRWTKLNLGACIQQGDYMHRGEQGLFESVGFRLFQLVGQPAMHTAFVQFRIIDAAEETSPGDQYSGDFWGLYLATEQPDGRFLEEHGLADGNFYKMEGGFGDPNNLGPDGPTDYSDLSAFIGAYESRPAEDWWRAHLNLPAYFGYQTIVQAIHHYDIADGKNYFYHRDPATGVWTVVPWDLDLTWADNMYRGGQTGGDEPFKSRLLSNFSATPLNPGIAREFRNRVREIRDLLWNDDEAFRLIDDYARLARGTNSSSILDADRCQWDYNPIMNSGVVDSSKAGWGRFYQMGTPTKDFAGMVRLMKNYVGYRATNATFSLDRMAAEPQRPAAPVLTHVGPAGFPANRLQFQATPFSGSAFASIKWRIAEISPRTPASFDPRIPQSYEIVPTWESGDLTEPVVAFTFPAGVARVGHLYRVRVRYLDTTGRASNWSAPIEFTAGPPDTAEALVGSLRLSEVMYDPPAGSEFEFVELHNASTDMALDLAGVRFTAGIDFTFPPGAVLAAGGHALVTRAGTPEQVAAVRAHYGLAAAVPVFGPYSGSLANDGETLSLKTAANGAIIFSVTYSDGRGWPVAADGAGHSLVPNESAVPGQAAGWLDYGGNWRASSFLKGSPGQADPPPDRSLVISELMAHTHLEDPQYPAFDSNDWIELHHAGGADVNLAGWFLSDDPADLKRWALPEVTLQSGSSVRFDEITGFHNPITTGFGLNHAGEELFLSYLPGNAQDRVVDAVRFKGQELDLSWGREGDSSPYWHGLLPTPGTANDSAPPSATITEIMYHPYDRLEGANRVDNLADEFIELHNPTAAPIALFDTNGVWRLDGGIGYLFPTNTTLAAGGYLVVVSFDPTSPVDLGAFRQRYGITESTVSIVGPYSGKLGNTTDRVALEKPRLPDRPGEAPSWVIVDEAIYSRGWPWPTVAPDGHGASLQRIGSSPAGNDPAVWRDAWPTAGFENFAASASDFDADGLPDRWESAVGLDPLDPAGGNGPAGDPDADGLTNRQEFEGGTDPRQPSMRLFSIRLAAGGVELEFNQPADLAVRLEAVEALGDGVWLTVASYPAQATAGLRQVTIPDEGPASARYYRVASP